MNDVFALVNKLGGMVQGVLAVFISGGLVLLFWQWRRFSTHHRRIEAALRVVDLSWDPSTNPELQQYLHPSRERIDIGGDRRFLLTLPRREMLAALAHKSRPLKLGGVFTGLALILTFGLIGFVLVTHMQAALDSFSNAGAGSSTPGQDALDQASRRLAQGVGGLGAKFFISATGIFFTVAYALLETRLDARHRRWLEELDRALRSVFASPQEYDALLQRRQLEALGDIGKTLERLNSIEVTVQSLSNDAVHHLSRALTQDVGERIEQIMAGALNRVEAIAEHTKQTFSADLQKAVGIAQQGIPTVVAHLEAIRNEVAQQAKSPVEALLTQFNSALSGGYQHETAQLGVALQQLATTVPEMARSLEAAGRHVTESVGEEQRRGQAMQQQLLSDMRQMFRQLEQQQTSMGDLVGRIHGEATATAASLGSTLRDQLDAAAKGFAEVAGTQTAEMKQRFESVLSTQQTAFAELETRVGVIVEALGQADRSLASSARHLESSARQLEATHATNDKGIAAATSLVNAARNSAEVLNHTSTNQATFLQQARLIVQEATEHAQREADLTRQLQAVWPGLLDKYLQSFQQKSDALASSWEVTHKKVVDVTAGVVDQLQQPVEDLCDAVKQLAETQKVRVAR